MIFCYSEENDSNSISENCKNIDSIADSMLSVMMGTIIYEIIRDTIDGVEDLS